MVRGRSAGALALARTGKEQTQISRELGEGISHVTVHRWIHGDRRPAPEIREKIHARYGIPPSAWDEPAGGVRKAAPRALSLAPPLAPESAAMPPPSGATPGYPRTPPPPPRFPPAPDPTLPPDRTLGEPASNDDATRAGGVFAMARSLERQAQRQLEELSRDEEQSVSDDPDAPAPASRWSPAERAQCTQRLASTLNMLAKLTGQHDLHRRLLQLPVWQEHERELRAVLRNFPDAAKAVAEHFERLESKWFRNAG